MTIQANEQSIAEAAIPSAEHVTKRIWKLMDCDIGIIPLPIYVVLAAVMIGFILHGKVPGEMAMAMGIMAVFAFTLGEIGNRFPVIRNIGAGAVLVTFIPSYLNYLHVIPEPMVKVVGDFFKFTNVLSLFIAAVIVGSILSMDRTVLIRGFMRIFVPLAAGTVVGATVGTLTGTALASGRSNPSSTSSFRSWAAASARAARSARTSAENCLSRAERAAYRLPRVRIWP